VLGYAELIKDNALGPINEEQKGAVSKIEQSANYLAGLVNDLLDEAQIETRNLSLNMGVFSPVDMLRQVKDRMSILAQNKELTLDADILPPFPNKLYGDEKRIQQILVNLTSNAIKFTKSGSIAIRIYQPVPNHWAMQVADTGVGIPQESQQDVFMPFRQLNNNVTRENRGTGLGLSIVKQIVELMNGTIELKSELNKGSAFTVILPIITPRETTS
jgi:signal transduction histidine kinase